MNIFEQATRQKLRFESIRGALSTDDLWDLPLTSKNGFDLDSVARATNAQLKAAGEESFVASVPNPAKARLELQMEVIKHIIAVRMQENENAKNLAARRAEREKLLRVLEEKNDERMKGMSVEEILSRVAELDKVA